MELNDFLSLIKRKKQTIVSLVIIFLVLGIILTAVQPFKYSSQLRLLVFQSSHQTNLDPYALTRSNEYLSGVLAKITYSTSFYNRVMTSDFGVDKDYFGLTDKKQNKRWAKTIDAKSINDTGIISIAAYHQDRQQAEQIARAVGHVLMTQHINYHGLDNNLKIKLLDEPITSSYPVKPNIALNLILAVGLGFIFSFAYIYLLPDRKFDIKLWFKRSNKDVDEVVAISESALPVKPLITETPQVEESIIEEPIAEQTAWPTVDDLLNQDQDDNDYPEPWTEPVEPANTEQSAEDWQALGNDLLFNETEPTEDQEEARQKDLEQLFK